MDNNKLNIDFKDRGNGYSVSVFKDSQVIAKAVLSVNGTNQLIQNGKGEFSLMSLEPHDNLAVVDYIISQSIKFISELKRPLSINVQNLPIEIVTNNKLVLEPIRGSGVYVYGENYGYNLDNIHSSRYSKLDNSRLSDDDKNKMKENLKKGGKKQEEELRDILSYKIMTIYAKTLVAVNEELKETGETLRFSFKFDGIVITNPFLDINEEHEVNPITYYGMNFIKSVFCDTCSISEALYSNAYDLGECNY